MCVFCVCVWSTPNPAHSPHCLPYLARACCSPCYAPSTCSPLTAAAPAAAPAPRALRQWSGLRAHHCVIGGVTMVGYWTIRVVSSPITPCGSKPVLLQYCRCSTILLILYVLPPRRILRFQRRQSQSSVFVPPAHYPFERLTPGRCLGVAARCGARCTPGGPDSRPGGPVVAPRSVVAYAFGAYICERQWPCLAQRFAPWLRVASPKTGYQQGCGSAS